jgi:hypothetical protein
MGAMTALITSACIGLSGSGQEACNKALEAGSKQSGIEQDVDRIEKHVTQNADQKGHEYLGDKGMEVVGGTAFVAKTLIDKSLVFGVPTFGICDRIVNKVEPNKYSLQLEWKF